MVQAYSSVLVVVSVMHEWQAYSQAGKERGSTSMASVWRAVIYSVARLSVCENLVTAAPLHRETEAAGQKAERGQNVSARPDPEGSCARDPLCENGCFLGGQPLASALVLMKIKSVGSFPVLVTGQIVGLAEVELQISVNLRHQSGCVRYERWRAVDRWNDTA